jgi:hypothetical protein
VRGDACFVAQLGGERMSCLVIANDSHKNAACAKTRNITRHITCTPDHELALRYRQHRRRRFRRNSRNIAVDEIVEHQVSDAEHSLLREPFDGVFKVEH